MLAVATEPHQVQWLTEAAADGEGQFLDGAARPRRGGLADLPRGAVQRRHLRDRQPGQAGPRAGARLPGGRRRDLRAHQRDADRLRAAPRCGCTPTGPPSPADQVVLATNVFPSLLRRNRLYTVPVYDYVLATEPLTDAQLARIGWRGRQGIGDSRQPVPLLPPDPGQPDRVGRLRRRLPLRPARSKSAYEDRPDTYRRLAAHFFITFPQLDDVRFSHRWAGAIDTNTRFCAHWGLAREGRVAYVNGFTGLGVGATRFAADVCLDLLDGTPTPRTELEMVRRKPLPFPPEPLASAGIQATRWSLDRADHSAGRRNVLLALSTPPVWASTPEPFVTDLYPTAMSRLHIITVGAEGSVSVRFSSSDAPGTVRGPRTAARPRPSVGARAGPAGCPRLPRHGDPPGHRAVHARATSTRRPGSAYTAGHCRASGTVSDKFGT